MNQEWTLVYYRYGQKYEHHSDTKEGALRYGIQGENYGDLSMFALLDTQGNVDMDKLALMEMYDKHDETEWW